METDERDLATGFSVFQIIVDYCAQEKHKVGIMIAVEKLKIHNYKCFKEFEIVFNEGISIIVGNNEEGKSTILEALQLALTGMLNGRTLFTDVYESLFNRKAIEDYIGSITTTKQPLPYILIEVFLKGDDLAKFEGDGSSYGGKECGLAFKVSFNNQYQDEYDALIKSGEVKSLPVEYYKIDRYTFARASVTNRSIPLKSVIIDSSSTRFQNGSDVYISKIIKDNLDEKEVAALAQSFRKLKESFGEVDAIEAINRKVSENAGISTKKVTVAVDMSVKNSWETVLMTYIDDVPFQQVGKGEQCLIKTNLALAHKKAQTSNLILIEEPENHLSHTRLNELLESITSKCEEKQLIITTHSNFVANKLSLKNLILLANQKTTRFADLDEGDANYFQKLPGYDTLRLILAKSAILVEGPSDELIVQRAYKDTYGCLPIQHGIDVISVRGLSFKRFLEIAKRIEKTVAVVTDNDGKYDERVTKNYELFKDVPCIKICASPDNTLKTLEPQFVHANNAKLSDLKSVIGVEGEDYTTDKSVSDYMENNKTDWALCVFESTIKFDYPNFIIEAINWVHEGE